MLNVKMSSKHIYSSDAPTCPKDYIISAHVDALTSVAGIVRTSCLQPKILDNSERGSGPVKASPAGKL